MDFAVLTLCSSVYTSINETPFFAIYGRDIRLPYNVLAMKHSVNYNDSPTYCENLIPNLSTVYKNVKANLENVAEKQVANRSKISKIKTLK